MIWKTFAGIRIYQGVNGITVHQNPIYRWLTLGSDAIQTLINRRHPERSGLRYIQPLTLAARAMPGMCCLLGLGGAGVAHALTLCFRDVQIDAVESNLDVIDIASEWFMTAQLKHLQVIHQDAFLFIQHTEKRYQHLIIDLFNANSFPVHCNNAEFFEHCQRVLLPGGILAVNLANLYEQWPVFMHIREHFPQCTVSIPVKGTANMIVLAYKGESIKPLLNLIEGESGLKRLNWDAHWGCVAEVY